MRLLDERSKRYCFAGDDSVSAAIADIVRGVLCPAVKAVLDHGMLKRSPLLSGPLHPWVFVEEAANKEVERDFRSVYSRLVLCKTFRWVQCNCGTICQYKICICNKTFLKEKI